MNEIDRRNFLALWFQALLMALFPMLRPAPAAAHRIAEGLVNRMVFKGGEMKLSIRVKGFEVDESWAEVLRANPTLRHALATECGITFAEPEQVEKFEKVLLSAGAVLK